MEWFIWGRLSYLSWLRQTYTSEIMKAKTTFEVMRGKNCQSRTMYQEKLSFKIEGKIKNYCLG